MAELRRLCQGKQDKPSLVFVHGLGGHLIDTWRHKDLPESNCWPHWVGEDTGWDTWVLGDDAALSAWQDRVLPASLRELILFSSVVLGFQR